MNETDSRDRALIAVIISASVVVILGVGITRFKVTERITPNFTHVRQQADQALANEMWNNQMLNNNSEAAIVAALHNHYSKLLKGYQAIRYTQPKTDIVYLLNMITTTGDSRETDVTAWESVAYFLPAVLVTAYIYSIAAKMIRNWVKGFFDPSQASERYTIDYDPTLEFGEFSDDFTNPSRCREKILTGAPAELSPLMGQVGLIGAIPKEETVPSILFIICLTIYIIAGTILVVAYKEYDFFTAFISFVRFIAFIEPFSVLDTIGGYLVLCMCYGGQILFVCTLIEQAHGIEVCLGRLDRSHHDPLSIDDSYVNARQSG